MRSTCPFTACARNFRPSARASRSSTSEASAMRSAMFPWKRSLRLQLMATYVVAMLLTGLGVAAVLAAILTWDMDGVARRGLTEQAQWIEQALRFDAAGRPVALVGGRYPLWIYEGASEDLKYRVLDSSGAVLLASDAGAQALVSEAQVFDPSLAMFKVAGGGLGLKAVTIPIEHQGIRFYIQTARSTRIQSLALHAIGEPVLHLSMWMGAVSLLVFGAAAYVMPCYMLRAFPDASDSA